NSVTTSRWPGRCSRVWNVPCDTVWLTLIRDQQALRPQERPAQPRETLRPRLTASSSVMLPPTNRKSCWWSISTTDTAAMPPRSLLRSLRPTKKVEPQQNESSTVDTHVAVLCFASFGAEQRERHCFRTAVQPAPATALEIRCPRRRLALADLRALRIQQCRRTRGSRRRRPGASRKWSDSRTRLHRRRVPH